MSDRVALADRRRFLQTALEAGAALAVPYLVPAPRSAKTAPCPPASRSSWAGSASAAAAPTTSAASWRSRTCGSSPAATCGPTAAGRQGSDRHAGTATTDCPAYRDFRDLLARPDIDAVLITTGSNWHALLSIFAAKAGKDVYCEKPCTKNIAESLALADTFRRTARVFQGGMQRRNLPHFEFAAELARQGKLGKLQTVHAHPGGLGTAHQRLAAGRSPNRPRTKSIGTCSSAPRPGGRSTPACSLGLREGRRHGRRRLPGMGLALHRPVPMGQQGRRHRARRVLPHRKRPGHRPLCQRREAGRPQRRLAAAGLLPRAL